MSDIDNPLIIPILAILNLDCVTSSGQSISEYELIVRLQRQLDDLPLRQESNQLALFQTHFLVMNALYCLQEELAEESVYLYISPLEIFLETRAKAIDQSTGRHLIDTHVDEALRSYYLDIKNLHDTTEEDVDALLSRFWQYYLAQDKQLEAYTVLGLTAEQSWSTVQDTYRRLAAENHPDRGGDASKFMVIREAYEVLLQVYRKA
ncbi:MAG: DNA-J related domain-containing protein [Pseudomonadales bacterium]